MENPVYINRLHESLHYHVCYYQDFSYEVMKNNIV